MMHRDTFTDTVTQTLKHLPTKTHTHVYIFIYAYSRLTHQIHHNVTHLFCTGVGYKSESTLLYYIFGNI